MFSNEVKVNGDFVKGTIRKSEKYNGIKEDYVYKLFSNMNFSKDARDWSADDIRKIANELIDVANEIDKQNNGIVKW